MLKAISKEYKSRSTEIASESQFENVRDVRVLCDSVLPKDDSALQWSETRVGKCSDLDSELGRLFERYVTYADGRIEHRKTEDDLWRVFSKELETRSLNTRLKSKTFRTSDDEVTFQKSFKNGIWHCVQPVSLDLVQSSSIKEKAHKWLGQISSVSEKADQFMLYFLVAEPSKPELKDSYEKAVAILEKVPSRNIVYTESESKKLVKDLEAVVVQQ